MPQNIYIYNPDVPVPKDVQHVEIPNGVTTIKRSAFENCSVLQSVTIPDSVTKINAYAFYKCHNLQSVIIPDGITEIGDSAFRDCSELMEFRIPDEVTEIGAGAFRDCVNLVSVIIPDSVKKIGDNAFHGCYSLQSVTIPDNVTVIGRGVFEGCSRFQSITIPDSVTEIGHSAFEGCSKLKEITIPDSVTEINDYAFRSCYRLQSVAIPDSVTKIGGWAFSNCIGLQSVTIPDNITEIGRGAFHECYALRSITIPDKVTEIGKFTFCGCSVLQSVKLPDSVKIIGRRAFFGCSALQSVTIPDSVTEISDGAFRGCSALQSVTIPESVTEIGACAFYNCSALQSVTIPHSVTKIGDSTFYDCSGLQSVTIPDGVTKIESGAFWGCSGLQSVTLPDSVTKISDHAFYCCSSLQSVTIPDGVTKIGKYAFCRCSGLQSVTIPDSVTEIDNFAFHKCSALQSVTMSNSVTEIGGFDFSDYPALQSLIYRGINIAPFINIDGYGIDTFSVIRALVEHHIPLSSHAVKTGIDMAHQGKLSEWIQGYPVFGTMRLQPAAKSADAETEEYLRRLFAAQKKTGCHVPKVLDKLAIAVCTCGIPPERLAETFDIGYTKNLLGENIPLVPATACRCYYDRGTCVMLIRKDKVPVMAEAISLYNRSGHRECYRHLIDFILSHPDTKTEDLQYAVDHAEEIPMKAGTTLMQVRQHRIYTESLAEVTKIEAKYGKVVPGFKLSDYPCSISPVGITYDGMTARVLDLSDKRDTALAARLGELTNCCQRLGNAGETAMMHGFLNPDAGFWVIEDANGTVKAQAEIWVADRGFLVFDNIEFADTDREHLSDRADRLRGVIAAWAMESGYKNIIMGCEYNELGTKNMENAPIPELRLAPEEVFALQEDNDAYVSFKNMDDVHQYMQDPEYDPADFVYTDANEQCVYIKKNGAVSNYLMKGYDRDLAGKSLSPGRRAGKEQDDDITRK